MTARAWAALGAVYVIWGSTYLAIRVLVEDLPPLLSAGARFLVAGAVLLGVLAARGRPVRLTAATALGAAIVGLLLPGGGNGLVMVAEQDVPSGLASLIIASVPLWVVVFRAALGREAIGRATLVGVVVGFAGVALLLGARPAGATTLGVTLLLVAAASWAFGSFLAGRLRLPADGLASAGWQMLFGGLGLLVSGLALGEPGDLALAHVGVAAWLSLAYLIVFGSLVAYVAYAWLLAHVPLSTVATYAYVNPIVAVALGWAVLDEEVALPTLLGAAIVVGSVALTVSREARPAARTTSTAPPASASGSHPARRAAAPVSPPGAACPERAGG